MTHAIDESKPHLKGINAYIQREIEPWLRSRESQREAVLARRWRITCAAAVVGIVVVAVLWFWLPPFPAMPLSILTLIVFFLVVGLATRRTVRLEADVKRFVMPKLAAFFRFNYEPTPAGFVLDRFVDLALLPPFDRHRREDGLSGSVGGVAFEFVEVELFREHTHTDSKGNEKTELDTIFEGLLFVLHPSISVDSTIVVTPSAGTSLERLAERFGEHAILTFSDEAFERAFKVIAADPDDARRLLDSTMRRRILSLQETLGQRELRLAFDARRILVSMATAAQDLFEAGSMETSLLDGQRLNRMVADMAVLFDVVGCLAAPAADT